MEACHSFSFAVTGACKHVIRYVDLHARQVIVCITSSVHTDSVCLQDLACGYGSSISRFAACTTTLKYGNARLRYAQTKNHGIRGHESARSCRERELLHHAVGSTQQRVGGPIVGNLGEHHHAHKPLSTVRLDPRRARSVFAAGVLIVLRSWDHVQPRVGPSRAAFRDHRHLTLFLWRVWRVHNFVHLFFMSRCREFAPAWLGPHTRHVEPRFSVVRCFVRMFFLQLLAPFVATKWGLSIHSCSIPPEGTLLCKHDRIFRAGIQT